MILTGNEIEIQVKSGSIIIDPFIPESINPNSYNFRLGNVLMVYNEEVIDTQKISRTIEFTIPKEGFVLEPYKLYLGHTIEKIGSIKYAPTYAARSSVARLGLFINLSAHLGDIGYIGQWTLQLFSINRIRIYSGMKIGQMMFWCPKGKIELYTGKYQKSYGPQASQIYKDKAYSIDLMKAEIPIMTEEAK